MPHVSARPAHAGLPMLGRLMRRLVPLAVGLFCLWLLATRLDQIDRAAMAQAFHQIALWQWAAALAATAGSFWAVGRYDTVIHRHLRTGVDSADATRAGAASIALAQTLGLGIITGAFARWRLLPALSPGQATQVSALVAVSFLSAWTVITALALPLLGSPPGLSPLWGSALSGSALWAAPPLLGALALAATALLSPRVALPLPGGRRIAICLPTLPAMGAILGLAFLDTLAAALALLILLPDGPGLGLVQLYPVFLIALGAALLTGTPGGVGPFELILFALLPHIPTPEFTAAILGFRLVYYAVPAILAVPLLMQPPRPTPALATPCPPVPPLPRPGPRALAHARRAELGVARQNGGRVLSTLRSRAVTVETGQTVTALFDPFEGSAATLLPALTARARLRNRIPVLYKCNARSAAQARRAGFRLWHLADEALIDPTTFTTTTPRHRQLRRKLRKADKSGLAITHAAHLPVPDMARVDAQWQARQGRARGFSMGRFCPDYLSDQLVLLAWHRGGLAGFVSFHVSAHEMCLDLMRWSDDAPDGTMHALVHAAIQYAAARGRTRLSLASIPARPGHAMPALERAARRLLAAMARGQGLDRFKSSFAPRYAPLYLATPSYAGLIIAGLDLAVSVRTATPKGLPKAPPHDVHDGFEFAPTRQM